MPMKKEGIIIYISDCRSCYDVPVYDYISDLSNNGLSHVLALTPSTVSVFQIVAFDLLSI